LGRVNEKVVKMGKEGNNKKSTSWTEGLKGFLVFPTILDSPKRCTTKKKARRFVSNPRIFTAPKKTGDTNCSKNARVEQVSILLTLEQNLGVT